MDFKQLKYISPAAALAFTAEIDRVRKVRTYPEIFRSLGGLLNDDAQLIQAATKIKRSSTNKKNRGRGLKDIKDYVKSVNNGMLKILSQRGEYAYFSNEKEYIKNRNIPLCGTLIQWKVPINIGE